MWQGLSPIIILAMTLVMESNTIPGMERVYTVLSNRAYHAERLRTVEALVRQAIKPYQFSCWKESNRETIERVKRESMYLTVALKLIERDPVRIEVGQARWYKTHQLFCDPNRPSWLRYGNITYDEGIGGHIFLEGVDEELPRNPKEDKFICSGD